MENYPSSEDMLRRAREELADAPPPPPPVDPADDDDDHAQGLAEALREDAAAGAPDPFVSRTPDPFRRVIPPPENLSAPSRPDPPPTTDPYDPKSGPATGDDRLVDWSKDQRAADTASERVGGLWRKVRPLIGIGVIVLFVVSAFVVRNDTSLEDLKVGDCFDNPGVDVELVEEIDTIPCDQPHDFEVFAQPQRADDLDYPGETALFAWADENCIRRFEAYVGTPWEESAIWATNMVPTAESWENGDRTVTCMLMQVNEDRTDIVPTTGTLRNSGL